MKKKNLFKLSKKALFIGLAVTLIVVISGYLLAREQHDERKPVAADDGRRPVNDINYDPPTKEELDETKRQKDQIIEDYKDSLNPSQPTSIGVTITRASQTATGQPLNIRAIIDNVTNGTCEVTLQREGQPTVSKTFNIVVEGTYTTCQQADIPAVEFAEGGDWTLEIVAKSGNLSSPVISQTVTIMK